MTDDKAFAVLTVLHNPNHATFVNNPPQLRRVVSVIMKVG